MAGLGLHIGVLVLSIQRLLLCEGNMRGEREKERQRDKNKTKILDFY